MSDEREESEGDILEQPITRRETQMLSLFSLFSFLFFYFFTPIPGIGEIGRDAHYGAREGWERYGSADETVIVFNHSREGDCRAISAEDRRG